MTTRISGGFTLIEVIVTLTVLAIVGTVVVLSTSSTKMNIFTAGQRLEQINAVQSCMDRLAAYSNAARMRDGTTPSVDDITKEATSVCTGCDVQMDKRALTINGEQAVDTNETYIHVTVKNGSVELYHVLGKK